MVLSIIIFVFHPDVWDHPPPPSVKGSSCHSFIFAVCSTKLCALQFPNWITSSPTLSACFTNPNASWDIPIHPTTVEVDCCIKISFYILETKSSKSQVAPTSTQALFTSLSSIFSSLFLDSGVACDTRWFPIALLVMKILITAIPTMKRADVAESTFLWRGLLPWLSSQSPRTTTPGLVCDLEQTLHPLGTLAASMIIFINSPSRRGRESFISSKLLMSMH